MKPIIYKELSEIPSLKFQGYVWKSDQEEPEVLHNEPYDFSNDSETNFIVEALLYNEEKDISIHINHFGDYNIVSYSLDQWKASDTTVEETCYLPHRLGKKVSRVKFKKLWIHEKDPFCEGMPVKKLKAIVFCGFKTN